MATTPRPLSSTSLSNHRRPFSSLTDTPTPASSTSASHHSQLMDSLNNNKQQQQPSHTHSRTHSRPLKPLSSATTRLANISNQQQSIDTLIEPIQPDDTELERKEHELSFERMMQELQDARISSSGSSASSETRGQRKLHDEERSSDFTEDEDEDDEDGSIRIGLSGIRYQHNPAATLPRRQQEEDEDEDVEHDSDELTYLTIPRSQLDPQSPAKPINGNNNVFSSFSSPRRLDSGVQTKENVPPPPVATSTRKPFLSTFSPPVRPSPPFTSVPSASTLQPQYRSSPLNPAQNSPVLAASSSSNPNHQRTTSLISNSATTVHGSPITGGAATAKKAGGGGGGGGGGKPVTIEEVSDRGTPPRSMVRGARQPVSSPNANRWRNNVNDSSPVRTGAAAATPGGKSVRLPDMTFLTEALESPAKVDRATFTSRRVVPGVGGGAAGSRQAGSVSNSTNSSKSKEAPLISGALNTLTSKLENLERENQASSVRVRQLEAQLAAQQQQQQAQTQTRQERQRLDEEEEEEVRREMLELLRGERERRQELESLVQQLQASSLEQQQQHAAARQPQPVSAPAPARLSPQACSTALELKDEVKDLKFGLQSLGYEVEGVRGVVEGLLRDKEEKLEEKRWGVEEEDRRATLLQQRHHEPASGSARGESKTDERPDTPRSEAGESEYSRRSFVSVEDIAKLQREQQIELERRTPRKSKDSNRRQHLSHPRRALSVASSYDSEQDSTYSPSLNSSVSTTSTSLTAPSESSISLDEEPDFDRAERIFKDVERAERRERRERLKERELQREQHGGTKVEDKSEELCKRCLGKKRSEDKGREQQAVSREKEKIRRERERLERERVEKEKEREREKEKERKKKMQERETHCRTLQAVLQRLEDDFASQKKIYLELTVEYQSMGSRASTRKRKALADHLKLSIDVLEEKAKDVKQYADALENLYHSNLTAATASKPSTHRHH